MSEKTTTGQTERQEMFDQYRHELENGYGFGHPSQWSKGPRNFAAYLASKRINADFNRAFERITK